MEIILAPMAGVTDLAFRLMARKHGVFGIPVSYTYTEMVSSRALHYNDKKTLELLKTSKEDFPLGVQIFGSEPEIMAEAARKIIDMQIADSIDINMGCPAKKIVKNGDGGALMKDLPRAGEIIRAVCKAAEGVPVTVKMRLGWGDSSPCASTLSFSLERGTAKTLGNEILPLPAYELAKIAEDAGAAGVTIHGRTVLQEFRGEANWDGICEVARRVSIPVVGNGDIKSRVDAENCGFERVMVGRGAMNGDLENAQEHLDLIEEFKGERAIFEARGVLIRYLKGQAEMRRRAASAKSYQEMREIVKHAKDICNLGC